MKIIKKINKMENNKKIKKKILYKNSPKGYFLLCQEDISL